MTDPDEIAQLKAERDRLNANNAEYRTELLVQAHEIERLRSQLPPEPGPGQHWRVGRNQPRNVYLHRDGDDEGVLIGQFSSPALAALACDAVNQAQTDTDGSPGDLWPC